MYLWELRWRGEELSRLMHDFHVFFFDRREKKPKFLYFSLRTAIPRHVPKGFFYSSVIAVLSFRSQCNKSLLFTLGTKCHNLWSVVSLFWVIIFICCSLLHELWFFSELLMIFEMFFEIFVGIMIPVNLFSKSLLSRAHWWRVNMKFTAYSLALSTFSFHQLIGTLWVHDD